MKLLSAALAALMLATPAWAEDRSPDLANGEAKFKRWCVACHGEGERHHPGTGALAKLYAGTDTPAVLAQRQDLSYDLLHFFIRNGTSIMPFFRKTELSDDDVQDLAAWLTRNYPKE